MVTEGARLGDSGARPALTTVFVSDPTAEAERIAQALRAAGYLVVDVPLSMLIARVAVQHPRVILVDADGDGALDVVARMRELPDADAIDVLFVARPGGAVASPEQALAHEGSGLFVRPVDVPSLVRKVEALTGGTASAPAPETAEGVAPVISVAPSRKRSSAPPPSLPPASMRSPESIAAAAQRRASPLAAGRSPSEPPPSAGPGTRRLVGLAPPVSPELQQLLSDAEQRAQAGTDGESVIPSPEDEIEAVLPAEYLASLDEPLEEDPDDDESGMPVRSSFGSAVREPTNDGGGTRSTTGTHTTGVGSGGGSTPAGTSGGTGSGRVATSDPGLTPAPITHGGTNSGGTGASTGGGSEPRAVAPAVAAPPEPPKRDSVAPPTAWSPALAAAPVVARVDVPDLGFPTVLGPGEALKALARAVVLRTSGALCFAAPDAERRVVLREGDMVTAASSSDDESLLAFLGVRGDLPKETVRRLEAKFPPFGRHAGAALVARGYLRQDQMWPTLRAHAEWVLTRALQAAQGRLVVESEPPARLAAEPSVFGGSTGAAVFVDLVRRIVPPAEALESLGGPASRLADGPGANLIVECALGSTEMEQLRGMQGRSIRDVLDGAPEGDLGTVIFALAQLGVIEVLRGVAPEIGGEDRASEAEVAAIDAEGVRERVRARLQLVEEGDYFALLGVSHEATGYEVRRAFLELRRAFDPSRVLTPEVADLDGAVRQITMVLEEAYDILKDAARRERYRRAIETVPDA